MYGMFYGMSTQVVTPTQQAKPQFSPVQKILQRVEKRGTFLQIRDMIEILLVSGFSFEKIKLLTISEFRNTVGGIVLEETSKDAEF